MSHANTPRVFLLNPPPTPEQQQGSLKPILTNLFFNSPPLGLASIAGVLERQRIPVRILDAGVEGFGLRETLRRIEEYKPDILGITSSSIFFANAVMVATHVKQLLPRVTIILGGPHASSCAPSAIEHECFDAAVVGEGELTMLDLVEAWRTGSSFAGIPGLVYRDQGEVVVNERRPLLKRLDDLPLPARHLLPMDKYIPQPNDGLYLPKHSMISSRGCPYRCIFCDHGTYGVSYRSFSPERIVDEMEELVYR